MLGVDLDQLVPTQPEKIIAPHARVSTESQVVPCRYSFGDEKIANVFLCR